jgi:regulator of RNase E activity RraA
VALLERCRRISTATWSDALDVLELDGVLEGISRRSGSGRVAGRAVTVIEEAGSLGDFDRSDFDVAGFVDIGNEGDVLIIACLGGGKASTFGGLAAARATKRGVCGVIIDGGCRDLDEIVISGLFVSSRFVTPRSGARRIRVLGINVPIKLGSVSVQPRDVVVADETGVVVIPSDRLDDVLDLAERFAHGDERFRRELDLGASFAEAAAASERI